MEDLPYKKWERTSPSQLDTYQRCARRWWWEKVRGLRSPDTEATRRGTEIHAELEEAVLNGTPAVDPVSLAILDHVGYHRLPREQLEREFTVHPPGWAVPIKGVIDRVEIPGQITDYKTTSSLRYAKTLKQLESNVQAVVYSWVGIHVLGMNDPLSFRLVYGERRKNQRTSRVEERKVVFTAEDLEPHMEALGALTHEKAQTALIKNPGDVPANTKACDDFGGCPHRARCRQYNPAPSWLGGNKIGETNMSNPSILAQLRARKNAQKSSSTSDQPMTAAERLKARKAAQNADTPAPQQPEALEQAKDIAAAAGVFASGMLVVMKNGGHTDTLTEEIEPGVWAMTSGVCARENEFEQYRSDPMAQGINPPDGVPAEEEIETPRAKSPKVPEHIREYAGTLVTKLKKAEAKDVRDRLLILLGLQDPWGNGHGKASVGDIKADIKDLIHMLEQKGPIDLHSNDSAEPVASEASSLSSSSEVTDSAPYVPGHDALHHWRGGRPLLLVGCHALGGHGVMDVSTLQELMAPYIARIEEEVGLNIGLISDYGVTGYAKAAALLDDALNASDNGLLPDVIQIQSAMEAGAKEAIAVLMKHCAVIGRAG